MAQREAFNLFYYDVSSNCDFPRLNLYITEKSPARSIPQSRALGAIPIFRHILEVDALATISEDSRLPHQQRYHHMQVARYHQMKSNPFPFHFRPKP